MQKLWPELPNPDLDQAANDPAPEAEPEAPPELPQAATTAGGTEPPTPPPTNNDEDDDYVPFFLTRGRLLRHIGLGKDTKLKLEWTGEKLVITSLYSPGFRTLHMPTKLVREVHYTTVEGYAHHPASKGFTP